MNISSGGIRFKLNTIERRDITISLLNEEHAPVITWKVKNAWPSKVQSTDLKAEGNEVAIESMEIVARRLNHSKRITMSNYYPPLGFHFKVEFANLSGEYQFQSVTGLSVELETEQIAEGGENRFKHKLPVSTPLSESGF